MTALFRCVLPCLSCVQMHRRMLLCALVLCVTTVDALRCYYGDDEDTDDRQCPELQSSCSKSTSTDPDTGHLAYLVNSSAYRPLLAFKM